MHKYLHHIGDFMRDTVHLSTLEECFYRRALDFYYLNEKPLPKETQSVFRRLRANTEEEQQAVLNILEDFFTEEDDGFHNKRCDAEILGYKGCAAKNRENGKKGGRPPKNVSNKNPQETQSVFRRLRANTEEEQQAVLNILEDFFTEEDDGFHNKRCDAEILGYKGCAAKNRENGKKGGRPPKNVSNKNPQETQSVNLGSESESQKNLNHKPITNNHKPITNIYTFDLEFVNVNLLKSGSKTIDQQYIDELQPQFELYYADQHMPDNKALVKFVQWIIRNHQKQQTAKPVTQYQTAAQRTASEHDRWKQAEQQAFGDSEIDITPKKQLLVSEVGHA